MEISAALWAVRLGKDFTFYVYIKEQVNTAEDLMYTPKYLILLHQSNSQLSLVTRLQQSAL